MANTNTTVTRVRELFEYNPENGHLIRRVKTNSRRTVIGTVAGSLDHGGYIEVGIDRHRFKAHRIIWLWVHGVWPDDQIDHINGMRDDNRIVNLRSVKQRINSQNLRRGRSDSSHGILGICFFKGKWQAQITLDRKQHYLGRYVTSQAAQDAYLAAKRRLHEGCTL